jgi:hypothetical protein
MLSIRPDASRKNLLQKMRVIASAGRIRPGIRARWIKSEQPRPWKADRSMAV